MKTRKHFAASALIVMLLAAPIASGCGSSNSSGTQPAPSPNAAEVNPAGDIPDNQAFVAFSPSGSDYSVKVPEGWSKTEPGGATTFTDKLNAIKTEENSSATAPTVASVGATEVPKLSKSVSGFANPQVTEVKRNSGSAVLITYEAKSKTDPVTGKSGTDDVERYLFSKNGKVVTLTLSGPQGADNVDPWMIVTDSFRWN